MKVGVIMGGTSSEREISLQSGEQVLLNLNKDKYEEIIP
ncbi:MAG: D-alanine--D-alanine ligase, partial [Clostridium celatum]|nr:D-alanine--D-alanine ligase [Clostridium celatum]